MTERYLEGQIALVTGSIQGIGLAIAERLAKAGASLIVHGLANEEQKQAAIDTVKAAGSPEVIAFTHNLSDPVACQQLIADAIAWKGRVDILVNNAGIQHTAALHEMPAEKWQAIIAINLSSAFYTMHGALPGMRERGYGRIVNIASVHGLIASANKAPYVASKFGLIGMSRVAALENADIGSAETGGITINCIAPGWTETVLIEPQIMARAAAAGGDRAAGVRALLSEKQPSLRMSAPSEIGEVTAMLCQKWAHNMNGITIPVDGGWTAQ